MRNISNRSYDSRRKLQNFRRRKDLPISGYRRNIDPIIDENCLSSFLLLNKRWIVMKSNGTQPNGILQFEAIPLQIRLLYFGHNGLHWKRFVRDKSAFPLPGVPFSPASFDSPVNRSRLTARRETARSKDKRTFYKNVAVVLPELRVSMLSKRTKIKPWRGWRIFKDTRIKHVGTHSIIRRVWNLSGCVIP